MAKAEERSEGTGSGRKTWEEWASDSEAATPIPPSTAAETITTRER